MRASHVCLTVLAAIVLLTIGCIDSKYPPTGNATGATVVSPFWPDHDVVSFEFPLEAGTIWNYTGETTFPEVDYDLEPGDDPIVTTQTFDVALICDGTDVMNEIEVTQLRELTLAEGAPYPSSSTMWVRNENDGLFVYGLQGYGYSVLPAPARGAGPDAGQGEIWRLMSGPISAALGPVSTNDLPWKALAYPLRRGAHWITAPHESIFEIAKRVVSRVRIEVPAGEFDCLVVEWFHTWAESGEPVTGLKVIDYYAREGLIKRTITVEGDITGPEGSARFGRAQSSTLEMRLVRVGPGNPLDPFNPETEGYEEGGGGTLDPPEVIGGN